MMSASALIQKRPHPSSFLSEWREIVLFRDTDKSSDIAALAGRRQPLIRASTAFAAIQTSLNRE